MPGLNTTGLPNTDDYNLGRGCLFFSTLGSDDLPDGNGYRDLGNAPEFNVTIETEELEHQSSRNGLKITDKRFVVSQTVNLSFTLDEANFQNLALFFSGSTETFTNVHDTAWAAHENSIVSSSIVLNRWYDLHDDGAYPGHGTNRVYDLGAASLVYSFEDDPGGTPAVLDTTDYTIDEVMGRVFFKAGGTNTLANGDEIGFAITTGAAAGNDLDQVNALQVDSVTGALKFIAENPGDDDNQTEYQFHKATIAATGDFQLISDEVTTMGFEGTAESNAAVPDTSKVLTVRTYDQTP